MPSIGVLEHNQKPTDKPTRRIKRSGGQSLVRSGLAEWIRENVLLKMMPVSMALTSLSNARQFNKSSLNPTPNMRCRLQTFKGKMPSHKSPGTRAIGPVVEQSGHGRARIIVANMIAAGR